jgi:hypothetical protein
MIPPRRQIQENGFNLGGLIEAAPPVFENYHES